MPKIETLRHKVSGRERGFTFVELLVVSTILLILASAVMVSQASARELPGTSKRAAKVIIVSGRAKAAAPASV